MSDVSTQLTLQTWMSAAFPTGAFTCSHGIETAIEDGRLHNAATCEDWIAGIIRHGSGWNDALLCSATYTTVDTLVEHESVTGSRVIPQTRRDALKASLHDLNALAMALCAGSERLKETTQLGTAFSLAAAVGAADGSPVSSLVEDDIALPVAMGVAASLAGIPLKQLLPAGLQAMSSNLVWICTRLVPLGQTQALTIISKLQPIIVSTAALAHDSTLDDLGSCSLLADLASIEHEQLRSRICIT